jgi:hypothetical protein
MLALNLQFSRLYDVIHLPLKPPTLPHPFWGMEEKSAEFMQILWARGRRLAPAMAANRALELSIAGRQIQNANRLRCWLLNLQSRARVPLNALDHAATSRFKFLSIA